MSLSINTEDALLALFDQEPGAMDQMVRVCERAVREAEAEGDESLFDLACLLDAIEKDIKPEMGP